ncbi:MAG: oligopeptide transporter, OPT family [Legionellaceae bacterium]|nr:oligopeptide transporter, OPT family [Legionellaceae bacterium]
MTEAPVEHATAETSIAELSVRAVILAIVLTLVLAMSNAYLALKLGILTSASIPAAIISMGILRFFKNATILENNAVQTAASAGEAVAGGIVYTIPALIIIHYWTGFPYWVNFFIAFSGGVLGVLFSIPLRRILVNDHSLRFPEGQAIAQVLQTSRENSGLGNILAGGLVGGLLELCQVGFKIIANSWSYWFVAKRALFGFGAGFSATMIGAGFLIGHQMAISIFLGAALSWLIALPLVSLGFPELIDSEHVAHSAHLLWDNEMRYLGIGAMLLAGIWTFVRLFRPLLRNVRQSFDDFVMQGRTRQKRLRTDLDIPVPFIFIGIILMSAVLFLFFQFIFPLEQLGMAENIGPTLVFAGVLYVLLIGFLFSLMTAFFSGMVGVTASPGSSVVIAGMLLIAWLLLCAMNTWLPLPFSASQLRAAEAISIMIGSVVTGIAAIANDNTQDLKVGQLVGATPWKQQVMLLLGVLVSALVIPAVMQLLYNVYGIAGVMPREGMDVSLSLPAPTAALMAAITRAVFSHSLPWLMMLAGAGLIVLIIIIQDVLFRKMMRLSILGVAIGMYLPLASSVPLFIGGLIAWLIQRQLHKRQLPELDYKDRLQRGVLIACGLVAGSALVDVLLAIPFSLLESPDALRISGLQWPGLALFLGVATTCWLAFWIRRRVFA